MRTETAAVRDWLGTARAYFTLLKPEITLLVLITVVTTMYMAAGGSLAPATVFWTILGTALSSGSASTLNSYIDRDIDTIMERTSDRPIPSGRVRAEAALIFGLVIGLLSVAVLAAFVNTLTAVLATSGALFYIVVYTWWLKRSTPQNIVIGGAAGAVGPLIGWAAGTGTVATPALLFFVIIFLWTPPHFWALALFRKQDYRRAGVPMLPVVHGEDATKRQILLYTVVLVLSSVAVFYLNISGVYYLTVAVILGACYVWLATATLRDHTVKTAYRLFAYSLVYLPVLFAAAVLNSRL